MSEEHAWYAAAEERYTAIKHSAADMDLSHVTSLTSEVNLHTATVMDLRENIVKLNFDQVNFFALICVVQNLHNYVSSIISPYYY